MVGHSCNAGTHATEWRGRDRVPTMYRLCTLTMHRLCTITSSRSGIGSRPESLREYFTKYGDVTEVMVMKDPTTRRSR
ncbi:RNA-binding protein Musashi homolog Rbp6 [Anthophora plagiata]